MTWVGSGEKEGESFHVCFCAAQCWLGTVAEQGSAWSASIYIRELSCILPPLVRNQEFAGDIVIDTSDADPAVVFSPLTGLICLDEW